MKKFNSTIFLCLLLGISLSAQFTRMNVEFTKNGVVLANPLTGGLNAPQLSEVDLNADGTMDLYIFDRIGEVHLTFLNEGSSNEPNYVFAPQFAQNFPRAYNFVLLRDFNGDGIMDLFAHAGATVTPPNAMTAWRGKIQNGKIKFDRILFDDSDYLNYQDEVGVTQLLEVPASDYPAFDDIDGDGDMDILTFNLAGSHVELFHNLSIEQTGGKEALIFEKTTDCWGGFYESMLSPELILAEEPGICAEGFSGNIHPGSTLLTYDEDNDGDMEFAVGDITYDKITKLHNEGDNLEAWMDVQDVNFPSYDVPVEIPLFPAPFLLDLDNDGLKDFVAAPNNLNNTPNVEVIWFYKNVTTNEFPEFEFQQSDFLVNTMLDFGTGAYPVFVDVNADGLLDLVVGNNSYWAGSSIMRDSRLHLFENIGTESTPKFELVDDNWLNFKQFSDIPQPQGSFAFAPAFGDLDDDGDLDLLVGEEGGNLFYTENTAGQGNPMTFGPIQFGWQGINIGTFSTPQIADFNKDGAVDLIIGEKNGNINYFPNQGTPTNPSFIPSPSMEPNVQRFGFMSTQKLGGVTGYSAPVVLDVGSSYQVVTGSEEGWLELYTDITENNLTDTFNLVTEQFGNKREGFRSALGMADINNDGLFEVIIGTSRGGLTLFGTNLTIDGVLPTYETIADFEASIYPNPTQDYLKIQYSNNKPLKGNYLIYNVFGQMMQHGVWSSEILTLEVSNLAPGLYFMEIEVNGKGKIVKRFVKE